MNKERIPKGVVWVFNWDLVYLAVVPCGQ
jgi:hypothetical protein